MEFEQYRDPKNKRRIIIPKGVDPKSFLLWITTPASDRSLDIALVAMTDEKLFEPINIDNEKYEGGES